MSANESREAAAPSSDSDAPTRGRASVPSADRDRARPSAHASSPSIDDSDRVARHFAADGNVPVGGQNQVHTVPLFSLQE